MPSTTGSIRCPNCSRGTYGQPDPESMQMEPREDPLNARRPPGLWHCDWCGFAFFVGSGSGEDNHKPGPGR